MKRRIAILVLVLAVVAAVIAGIMIFQRKNREPDASAAIAETEQRDVQVPDIGGNSDSAATDESDSVLILDIQAESIDDGYTLPNQSRPKDIPPE